MPAEAEFIEAVLASHNAKRALHGAPPLEHNAELSAFAQEWADQLAARDAFEHRQDRGFQGGVVGENLAGGSGNLSGEAVTAMWYDEIKDFVFGKTQFTMNTGHFSQVVWKGSRQLGVGKAVNSQGMTVVVANYSPAGNMQGSFEQNVLPPQ